MEILLATSEAAIAQCFPVMHFLRPHLVEAEFFDRVQRQQQQGYQLAYVEDGGGVRAIAGFRITENLMRGKFLYVDDLVTGEGDRSQGYGASLFEWLVEQAKVQGCDYLELDSGVQRFAAHRFYFRQRMEIASYHFALKL
jgi:GNAT superfamily N-acetyltransferase